MSRRFKVQDATGIVLNGPDPTKSILSYTRGAPTNSQSGYDPGCINQDLTNGALYVNIGTSTSSNWVLFFPTGFAVGTAGTGVTAAEQGNGLLHRTILTLTAVSVALSDANTGGGSLIYTFPTGGISILGGLAVLTTTTTTTLSSTLNASVALSWGVGSVQTTTQGSGTLVTTEQDIVNAGTATSSATINVAGSTDYAKTGTLKGFDGHSSAITAYLNYGVPTGTDIDGDATITVSGTVELVWCFNGAL